MLAGNLGSIAIGGIIATIISLVVSKYLYSISDIGALILGIVQWPEDYDFAGTRAINSSASPAHHSEPVICRPQEFQDDKAKGTGTSTSSIIVEVAKVEAENERVALMKAFKFAAWSSIVLVRFSPEISYDFRPLIT